MCGLVGLAGRYVTDKHWKLFNQMLVGSTMRGRDSTGVAVISKPYQQKVEARTLKVVGTPFDLGDHRQYDQLTKTPAVKCLIGHTRSATKGNVTRSNAHPFDVGDIIGAHNGTIHEKQPNDHLFGTDSECMYENIAEKGLKEYMGTIRGAWALTYWNFEDETLNFLRNSERPLAIAVAPDDEMIYWASEAGMLYWFLSRNDIKVKDLFNLPVDQHIAFKLLQDNWTNTGVRNEVKQREVTANPVAPFPQREQGPANGAQAGKEGSAASSQQGTERSQQQAMSMVDKAFHEAALKRQAAAAKSLTNGSNVVALPSSETSSTATGTTTDAKKPKIKSFKGFDGEWITKGEHLHNLEFGCAWCGEVEDPSNPIRYISKTDYFCSECKSAEDVEHKLTTTMGMMYAQRPNVSIN